VTYDADSKYTIESINGEKATILIETKSGQTQTGKVLHEQNVFLTLPVMLYSLFNFFQFPRGNLDIK
jgi:hypothetical protein